VPLNTNQPTFYPAPKPPGWSFTDSGGENGEGKGKEGESERVNERERRKEGKAKGHRKVTFPFSDS